MTATYSSLNLVLLGPPGSGKSTQARVLAANYQLPLISTREMLRSEVERGTALGTEIGNCIQRGELVSDRLMSGMILQRLDREDCRRGFILDGYPRTVDQAVLLDGILAELGRGIERVVLLEVEEDAGLDRLKAAGEADDQLESAIEDGADGAAVRSSAGDPEKLARERFRVWRENAPSLIEFYRNRGVMLDVDGRQSEREVSDSVLQAVGAPVGA